MPTQTPIDQPIRCTRRGVLQLLPPALACSTFPAMAQNVLIGGTTAQPLSLDPARIASTLTGMVDSGRAGGASALIWKGGREAYFGSAGFADREVGRRMTRDTIVQIYSMTKPVTGVALMQLWERAKFALDDPLFRYLPEFESMRVYAGKDAARDRPCIARPRGRYLCGTSCATQQGSPMGQGTRPLTMPT